VASLRINLARLAMGLGSSNVLVESIIERLQRFRSRLPGNLYFPIFGNRNMKCDENFSFFFFFNLPSTACFEYSGWATFGPNFIVGS